MTTSVADTQFIHLGSDISMEYYALASINFSYRFMYRYVSPLKSTWLVREVSYLEFHLGMDLTKFAFDHRPVMMEGNDIMKGLCSK